MPFSALKEILKAGDRIDDHAVGIERGGALGEPADEGRVVHGRREGLLSAVRVGGVGAQVEKRDRLGVDTDRCRLLPKFDFSLGEMDEQGRLAAFGSGFEKP